MNKCIHIFTNPVNSQVLDVAGEGDVASDGCGVVWDTTRELRQQSFMWEKWERRLRVSTFSLSLNSCVSSSQLIPCLTPYKDPQSFAGNFPGEEWNLKN